MGRWWAVEVHVEICQCQHSVFDDIVHVRTVSHQLVFSQPVKLCRSMVQTTCMLFTLADLFKEYIQIMIRSTVNNTPDTQTRTRVGKLFYLQTPSNVRKSVTGQLN